MNRSLACSFFLFLVVSIGSSQYNFVKTYNFGTVESVYQIVNYNGRVFANTATFCNNECSFLSEIDKWGNILWRIEVPDIDIASGTMVILNDTITITGNNDPHNTAFRMAHFTLNGEKLGETMEIEHPIRKFTRMFQLTTQYFNGKYAICGRGIQNDTMRALIYIVSSTGHLDTLIEVEEAYQSRLWHSYIDSEDRLTTYHWVEHNNSTVNYRKIFKFDTNYDTVWTYRSENTQYNDVIPYGCELQDGRTILSYTNPEQIENINSVRAIRPDGSIAWQHNYAVSGSRNRNIYRLKTLANGDIMGSGSYTEKAGNPRISDSPWLFRMSPEGVLLWERVYYDFDSTLGSNGSSRVGTLIDFIELEGGDILAVGDLWYNLQSDMLIMRVDSNGCLNPADCHEVNVIDIKTATNDAPSVEAAFTLYPNPASQTLYLDIPGPDYPAGYVITDMTGRRALSGTAHAETAIDIASLPNGLYLIIVYREGQMYGVKRFVVVK